MKKVAIPIALLAFMASCSSGVDTKENLETANHFPIDSIAVENADPMVSEIAEVEEEEVVPAVKTDAAKRNAATQKVTSTTKSVSPVQGSTTVATKPVIEEPVAAEPEKKKGMSHTAKGAIVGAAAGAVTGAVVNKKDPLKGAAIGTAVGAAAGAGTGLIVDKSVKNKQEKAQ